MTCDAWLLQIKGHICKQEREREDKTVCSEAEEKHDGMCGEYKYRKIQNEKNYNGRETIIIVDGL